MRNTHRGVLETGVGDAGGGGEIIVANARLIKNVPGRKTDVKDAEWVADLLCHGSLRSSFVPPKPIRELRDLLHYRRKLVDRASGGGDHGRVRDR